MSDSDIYRTTGPGAVSRRGFLKLGAAGTVGAAGLGGAGDLAPSAVGESEAIAPVILVGGAALAAGAGVNIGWALREYEVLGSDDPAEGLTPEVLQSQVYETARKRQSDNRSTFVDNRNIVETGYEHSLYADGKLAAIEALNDEKAESEVLADAKAAAEEYASTVQKNLLKSWNASMSEFVNLVQSYKDHPDLDPVEDITNSVNFVPGGNTYYWVPDQVSSERDVTLPNGDTFTVTTLYIKCENYDANEHGPSQAYAYDSTAAIEGYDQNFTFKTPDGDVTYLSFEEWNGVWTTLTTALDNVRSGLDTWVTNVYSDVQAGELNTEDLLTPRELAAMSADEEGFNQAVADLMALNISVNLEREAEVNIPRINGTVKGQIGVTGDTTLETGTVDPSADSVDYYLTYDISQGEGTWTDYNSGIDGGTVTFTAEPYEQTEFDIETNGGETVTVTADDFSGQGDGTWTADLSDQLETDIAEINSVAFYATTSETQYETVQLTEEFEIVTFRDTETGDEYDSAEHSSNEPQDDTNYITEEEWQDMQDRQEELIDKYEESQQPGGAGSILPDDLGGSTGMLLLVLAGGAAVLGLQGDS